MCGKERSSISPCQGTLVSVIIPTYNRAESVSGAIESVIAQTHRPIELIVVDDGSTDNTEEVVRSRADRQDGGFSIRYLKQPNAGAPAARNRGLAESCGEYVKFLDSDDRIEWNSIERQVAAIRESRADVITGDWRDLYADRAGNESRGKSRGPGPLPDPVTGLLERRWSALFCYLFTREAVSRSGGWDERLKGNQDFGFALRVALAGAAFLYVPGVVGTYRHGGAGRVSLMNRYEWAKSTELVLVEAEARLRADGNLTDVRRNALAGYYLVIAKEVYGRDRELFQRYIGEMLRLSPDYRAPGWFYRNLVALIGYERTEGLLEIRRLIRRHAAKV